ncbi:MAG: hypothetical protein JWN25_57, partial [Verrucomicrobiales bacterium]|nr:hypothetical protein [Verrucomicrobiales bacterium]
MNLAGLFGIGLLMATLNSFAGSVMVETGNTRVLFSEETGGVLGIVDRTSGKNFISKVAEKPGLWRLKLRGGNGELIQLDSRSAARPGVYSQRGSVEFVWTNLQAKGVTGGFDVRVVCKVSHSDGLAHFRIDVQNKSNSSILSALFPELDGFGTAGTSDVAFPKYNWGEMFRGLKGKLYGNYPSADMPMQFCSITEGSNSVYFAAEDPGALFKTFLMEPGVTFSVETSVPNATIVGNNWKEAFDFVVGTYEGDWMRGCKLYREWALKSAPWTAKGPIARRKDVAKAVKEVGVWLNVSEHFVENEKSALAFRKEIGVPIGVQWYNWHRNPFDKEYPDYLPPKPGFVNSVKELKQAGIYSMPYINGRLWDTANTNYAEARPYATALENGERFLEDYQSGTKLAVMCLGNPFWQTNLAGLIERIAAETGVGGIYIDQVAGAPIAECFDPSHGHSLGRD